MSGSRQTIWLWGAAVCVTTAVTLFFWRPRQETTKRRVPDMEKARQVSRREFATPIPSPAPSVQAPEPIASPSVVAKKPPSPRGEVAALSIAEIGEAITRYNKTGLQIIARHLEDTDPEVRRAACEGLTQLGESDAIPILEKLALQTTDPEEANRLREAANFLKLPAADLHELMKARRARRESASIGRPVTFPSLPRSPSR